MTPCNPPSDSPLVTTVMDLRSLTDGIKIKYNYTNNVGIIVDMELQRTKRVVE